MKTYFFGMICILAILGLFSGCTSKKDAPAATLPPASFDEIKPIAETFVDQMAKGEYADAVTLFDPEISGSSMQNKLKQSWEELTGQVGAFQQKTETQTEVVKGLRAVYVTCQFEKDQVDVRIFFNPEDQIRGMNFAQAKPHK